MRICRRGWEGGGYSNNNNNNGAGGGNGNANAAQMGRRILSPSQMAILVEEEGVLPRGRRIPRMRMRTGTRKRGRWWLRRGCRCRLLRWQAPPRPPRRNRSPERKTPFLDPALLLAHQPRQRALLARHRGGGRAAFVRRRNWQRRAFAEPVDVGACASEAG
ncbi:hypothetical protein B0H13DRAFT_2146629, partial [Mycena leptocephala]